MTDETAGEAGGNTQQSGHRPETCGCNKNQNKKNPPHIFCKAIENPSVVKRLWNAVIKMPVVILEAFRETLRGNF